MAVKMGGGQFVMMPGMGHGGMRGEGREAEPQCSQPCSVTFLPRPHLTQPHRNLGDLNFMSICCLAENLGGVEKEPKSQQLN
jgi:hypothetical protein